jgi:hypothetical protein
MKSLSYVSTPAQLFLDYLHFFEFSVFLKMYEYDLHDDVDVVYSDDPYIRSQQDHLLRIMMCNEVKPIEGKERRVSPNICSAM